MDETSGLSGGDDGGLYGYHTPLGLVVVVSGCLELALHLHAGRAGVGGSELSEGGEKHGPRAASRK